MKIQIFNWAGETKVQKDIEALGHRHRQIVDGDVYEIAKKFVVCGHNVMIMQGDGTMCNFVVAVDTQSFRQR